MEDKKYIPGMGAMVALIIAMVALQLAFLAGAVTLGVLWVYPTFGTVATVMYFVAVLLLIAMFRGGK